MNIPNFCSRMLIGHSNLKPKLSASLLWGYLQTKPETLVFWGPVFGTWFRPLERFVSLIWREQIRSQHACSFHFLLFGVEGWKYSSLFEAHIWPKKGFQKRERRTWRFVRFHTPRTICFYWTCSKCASDKIALENFHKFAFTSKEPFLCNMFALDFISWLISWQRGLYAENNFFKKCPFLAFFWASSFGTKFVLLEAYTWSNMIYLNWSSKEEYVCLTR